MNRTQGALLLLLAPTLLAQTKTEQFQAGGGPKDGAPLEVFACLQLLTNVNYQAVAFGKGTAVRIFQGIGVRLRWCCDGRATAASRLPHNTIVIQVIDRAPARFEREALAYALPYAHDGVRIRVFYDRFEPIFASGSIPGSTIFGYTLAHEIGHVLSGVASHSGSGLMRARWTGEDFACMRAHSLRFTADNAEFIRNNIARKFISPARPEAHLTPTGAFD